VKARRTLRSRERGIAVVTALLVVTIATVLAVEIAWETTLDLRRTESLLAREQAQQFGYGAEAYAAQLMDEVFREKTAAIEVYSRNEDYRACGGFQFELEQGRMTGGVCDLQGRFNLNNLLNGGRRDEQIMNQYRRLLAAISLLNEEIDIDADTIDVIVESTVDWLDPDSDAEFNGAEADTYTSLQPPYRAANFWFTSVSELRAVRGMTPEIYRAVAPYVAALPVGGEQTKINVNTAAVPVLMSLGDDITVVNAEQWVEDSASEAFEDETPFKELADDTMLRYIDYTSRYFELRGLISIGTSQLGMYSLLENTGQGFVPRLRQFDVVDAVPLPDAAASIEPVDDEDVEDPR
jgi:general secretion pathway protein K